MESIKFQRFARVPVVVALSIMTLAASDVSAQLFTFVDPESVVRDPWQTKQITELQASEAVVEWTLATAIVTGLVEGRSVAINIQPGQPPVTFTNRSFEQYSADGFNWSGRGPDGVSFAVLTVERGTVLGIVRLGHRLFEIRPFGGGLHLLIEWADELLPPETQFELLQRESVLHKMYLDEQLVSLEAECSTVTLLVAYTTELRAAVEGGGATVQQFVENRVFDVNEAFLNSLINLKIKRVFMYETPDGQSQRAGCLSVAHDVYRLQTDGDDWFDEVHFYRDLYAADIVVLLGDYGTCGGMSAAVFADEATAFVVTSRDAAMSNLSLAHEIGHVFGGGHNPEEIYAYSPFDDGKALCHYTPTSSYPSGWRTVLSYKGGPDVDGDGVPDYYCNTRLPCYSNPNVVIDGSPAGLVNQQDNTNVISTTACVVAAFRREATLDVSPLPLVLSSTAPVMLTINVRRGGRPVPFADVRISFRPFGGLKTIPSVTAGAGGDATVPVVGVTPGPVSIQLRSEGAAMYLTAIVE